MLLTNLFGLNRILKKYYMSSVFGYQLLLGIFGLVSWLRLRSDRAARLLPNLELLRDLEFLLWILTIWCIR